MPFANFVYHFHWIPLQNFGKRSYNPLNDLFDLNGWFVILIDIESKQIDLEILVLNNLGWATGIIVKPSLTMYGGQRIFFFVSLRDVSLVLNPTNALITRCSVRYIRPFCFPYWLTPAPPSLGLLRAPIPSPLLWSCPPWGQYGSGRLLPLLPGCGGELRKKRRAARLLRKLSFGDLLWPRRLAGRAPADRCGGGRGNVMLLRRPSDESSPILRRNCAAFQDAALQHGWILGTLPVQ